MVPGVAGAGTSPASERHLVVHTHACTHTHTHPPTRTCVGLMVPVLALMVVKQASLHRALAVPAPVVTTAHAAQRSN